ncbi:hypothetical protein Q0Y04_19200 [Clostridioides difficile]|nr:hypothetical protein Q0Y04_19200 [Clostridioides difficile]
MGGGLGLLPKSEQFYKELNSLEGVKTTVITGNNKKCTINYMVDMKI